MKATGVVRRMDNLGRIVIPKEIRRTLRIREGDPLEIFTGPEGEVIFKKYSPIGDLSNIAKNYTDSLAKTTDCTVCVTDKDVIVAASGKERTHLELKEISKDLLRTIERRENVISKKGDKDFVAIISNAPEFLSEIIITIICEGDAVGSVVILSHVENMDKVNLKLAKSVAIMLGKQMEN